MQEVTVTLLQLPATLAELLASSQESPTESPGILVQDFCNATALCWHAVNLTRSPNPRNIFRVLDIALTISLPNGTREQCFQLRRGKDAAGTFLSVTPRDLSVLRRRRQYLDSLCDFARYVGCERVITTA